MILKMKSELKGSHVYTTYSTASDAGITFVNCGTLIQTVPEWQLLGAAMLMGAIQTKGRLRVICEGDEAVSEAYGEIEEEV